MRVLVDLFKQGWFIFLLLVVIFGLLTLAIFLIRKFIINKNKKDDKPTDEKAAEETLGRYLEDVKDPEAIKEFDEYDKSKED